MLTNNFRFWKCKALKWATIVAKVAATIAPCMHRTMLIIVDRDIGSYSGIAARQFRDQQAYL